MLQLVIKHGYSLVSIIKQNKVVVVKDDKCIEYVIKLFSDMNSFINELHYYKLALKYGIAPKMTYNTKDLIIISEKMNSLVDGYGKLIDSNIITEEFIQNLDNKINIMHKLGFAHGDLSSHNIVYNNDNIPFIIDFENSYEIRDHTWSTELWMREAFEWQTSYEDFVNHDYMLWKEFLMLPQISSYKTPVNENYYDVRFNIQNYNICCGSFAKCLQEKLGGIIYGISELKERSVPVHYVLLTDKFIDCTGVYTDEISMLKIIKSRYENELDDDLIRYKVDQNTCDIVEYIVNII